MLDIPACFCKLPNFLTALLEDPALSADDFRQLHHSLEASWEKVSMDALLAGHPFWYVCTGKTACQLFLYRTWHWSKSLRQNKAKLHQIQEQLQIQFVPAEGLQITPQSAEHLLQLLEEDFAFSHKVLAPTPMLIFLPDCGHQTYDAFCRPYVLKNNAVVCDIFLPYILRDKIATPESIFLHELGHVVNVRLTGDVTQAPPAFLDFGEPFFPGLSTKHRSISGELFAHCFAMGVFSRHPELREFDPFTEVAPEDKQAFQHFVEALICALPG